MHQSRLVRSYRRGKSGRVGGFASSGAAWDRCSQRDNQTFRYLRVAEPSVGHPKPKELTIARRQSGGGSVDGRLVVEFDAVHFGRDGAVAVLAMLARGVSPTDLPCALMSTRMLPAEPSWPTTPGVVQV